jgi:hypothetical protein
VDAVSVLIETLKGRGAATSLERDILDTYHELNKNPFDRDSAIKKIIENNANYPDIFMAISTRSNMVLKPWATASDDDVFSNLTSQLGALVGKEWEALNGVQ